MRHVLKVHAVEAIQIPKGAKVTVKLPHQPLQMAEGGDYLLLGQGDPTAPPIALMDKGAFESRYQAELVPAMLAAPAKQQRGRGGKRPGPKPRPRTPVRASTPVARGTRAPRGTPEQMAEAKRLIEKEGLNIRETANRLGLTDQAGYQRVWKWAKTNGWGA